MAKLHSFLEDAWENLSFPAARNYPHSSAHDPFLHHRRHWRRAVSFPGHAPRPISLPPSSSFKEPHDDTGPTHTIYDPFL